MSDVTTPSPVEEFVARLARAEPRLGPGGVAALRRGAGNPVAVPAPAAGAFFSLSPPTTPDLESAAWVAATLWARHPQHRRGYGSFGQSLRGLATTHESAAARLLARLLGADRDELPVALRRAIGLLRDKEVPVDYGQLIWDIRGWDTPNRDVQRRWARDFHRVKAAAANDTSVETIQKEQG